MTRKHSPLQLTLCALLAASLVAPALAAPSLPVTKPPVMSDPSGIGPRYTGPPIDPTASGGQWFIRPDADAEFRSHEFYDNVPGFGGGFAGSAAIRGVVTFVLFDPLGFNIVYFEITATITNDTGADTMWLDGTNSHLEYLKTPDQYVGTLYRTKLTGEFAIADPLVPIFVDPPYRDRQPYIIAENEDQLAWYCYSPDNPDPHQVPWGAYLVPTWDFGDIPMGGSMSRELKFSVDGAGLPPMDPRYGVILDSYQTGQDILLNRTTSLKISTWIDELGIDDGSPYPEGVLRSSDVSVFHNVAPEYYTLTVTIINPQYGTVDIVPDWPAYPPYTPVTLTARPEPNRGFKKWVVYDPNFPGDPNYATEDTNLVLNIIMDGNYEVEARFMCSSGMGDVLPMMALAAGVLGCVSFRRRQQT